MVPVLFLVILSCGVPTYLYIEESEIQFDSNVLTENESFSVTVNLTEDALDEFRDRDTVPAVKLFYVLSTDSLASSQISSLSSLPVRSESQTAFRRLYIKEGGNGDMWTPQSVSQASGFYIYKTPETSVTYQTTRPEYEEDTEYDVVLASTFSYSASAASGGEFATAPDMDISIPVSSFQPEPSPPFSTYTFTIRALDTAGRYSTLGLYDQADTLIGYMNNERKAQFFGADTDTDTLTVDEIKQRYEAYDGVSYRVLSDALIEGSALYLHIFASLYGGNGDATNIYWSPLQEVGTLRLR